MMLLTTSRKPGRKTRTFAKVLASFMNWKYESRGKSGLNFSEKKVAVIEERNGNPRLIRITTQSGRYIMEFNVSNINRIKLDSSPAVFFGNPPFDPKILEAIPTRIRMNFDPDKKIFVKKIRGAYFLDFRYRGVSVFRLRLLKWGKENES